MPQEVETFTRKGDRTSGEEKRAMGLE